MTGEAPVGADAAESLVAATALGGEGGLGRAAGLLLAALALTLPSPAASQTPGLPLTPGGLLRTGIRFEPEDAPRRDGFEVFDARLSLSGKVGIVFEYFLQTSFVGPSEEDVEREGVDLELLDARLTLPFMPEAEFSVGQFKAPFGQEALTPKDRTRFLERSMASRAVAPGRQVGLELHGEMLEARLLYRGGVFNGNGRALENDDDDFLYAARVQYNTVGPVEFYEDLVLQVGANVAFSDDLAARLGPGMDGTLPGDPGIPGLDFGSFRGDRFLYGFDLHASYRGWTANGEFLRAELEPESSEGLELGEVDADGGYLEVAYSLFGAAEAAARYDFFNPALGPGRDFLILGVAIFPGFHAKLGAQYAFGLGGSPPAPGIADGQLAFLAQMSF